MKIRQLIVLFCTVLALNPIAFAQHTPVEKTNAFASAFSALKKSDSVYEMKIPAVELARRERENVAANREALAQLRLLLQNSLQGWEARVPVTSQEALKSFKTNANLREFARLLVRESNVRLADGDAVGAMQSRLDCYQLAVTLAKSETMLDNLVAISIEGLAWKQIEKVGSKLDGKSCLDFFNRIEALRRGRTSYVTVIRSEKAYSLAEFREQGKTFEWKSLLVGKDTVKFSPPQIEQMRTVTPSQTEANLTSAFDMAIAKAEEPFKPSATPLKAADAYSNFTVAIYSDFGTRFIFERSETNTRLVQAAFLLRARQLGVLPASEFERLLPRDTFAESPLKLQDTFVYSVGPDGKDNGGKSFKHIWYSFDAKTGQYVKRINNVPQPDSLGDILGPNFIG